MADDKRKDKLISLRLPKEHYEEIKKHDRNVSWVIQKAIETYITNIKPISEIKKSWLKK